MSDLIHVLGPLAIGVTTVALGLAALLWRGSGLARKIGGAASLCVALFAGFVVWQMYKPVPTVRAEAGRVPAVGVGDRYRDFTLPDASGTPFTLSSLEGKWILLKFFRGHW